jgi:transcriptional/translational regulatory protein YebC/TACO1
MLYRHEVIKMMSDMIEEMNTQMAKQQGMPDSEIERVLGQARPQLDYVNGMLYDLLVQNGVIVKQ